MISSRKQEGLDAAADGIREQVPGAHVETFAANAGEPDQAEACVEAAVTRLGGIDVLVNNAGTNPVMGRTIDADLGAWDKTFRVNVRGALVWTQHAWRATMEQHGGSVINISSVGGISGTSGIGAYNITKAALIHLTKVLAVELAPRVPGRLGRGQSRRVQDQVVLPAALLPDVQRGVHRDRVEPGPELGPDGEGLQPAVRPEKDRLDQVIGLGVIAHDAVRDRVHQPLVPLDEPVEGRTVSPERPDDQITVGQ